MRKRKGQAPAPGSCPPMPAFPMSAFPVSALDMEQPPIYAPPPYVPAPMPHPGPSTYRPAMMSVMGNADATVAQVRLELHDPGQGPRVFTGSGASKRERGDSHDPLTGEVLAAARAYQELSARLFREARKRVRVQEAERQARELRKLKADKKHWEEQAVIDVNPESPF